MCHVVDKIDRDISEESSQDNSFHHADVLEIQLETKLDIKLTIAF